MLVGREPECREIETRVAAARVGHSAVLVLSGEAGIGKSALLDHAAGLARGMCVLRATGTEAEGEVPFGGLLQLLRPALVHLDRIPSPQGDALASALALRPGTAGDRFAVGAATLSLLSRFAEDQPLAVLLDDAHLLDLPSAQALVFAARRLTADPVVVLAAVREGHPGPLTQADLPVLPLSGLSLAATGELVRAAGRRLGAASLSRLHAVTGGNPLAVEELADDVDGLDPGPFGTPGPVPASLARAFARRVDRLSDQARTAVLVAAAAGDDLGLVHRACALLHVDPSALDEAEQAGLLRTSARGIAFRHGLVRSAVHSDAPAGARRAVHRALADAVPADDVDRRAWHLGEGTPGADEQVARALDAVAARARARSAHGVAAAASERAARLSEDDDGRARRLADAGESAWRAGTVEHAVRLLDAAAPARAPLALRVRVAGLQGTIAARTGSVETARDLLVRAGTDLAGSDPDAAVLLLAEAVLACFLLGDTTTVQTTAELVDRLVASAVTEPARLVGATACGVAAVLTGRGGADRIRSAVQAAVPTSALLDDPRVAPWLVLGPLFLRESGTGRALVQRVVDDLRRRSAVGELPFLLFHVARDQATTDRWDEAALSYAEGIELAREAGQTSDLTACLAGLAWLEAREGEAAACRAHAQEAVALCAPRRIAMFRCWSMSALGELELGLGRPDVAVQHLVALEALLDELGLGDVDLSPAPELAEALVRLGRDDEARERAQRYAARAAVKGQPFAQARAERAAVLTCPDADVDAHAERALAHHGRTLDSFELARTRLAHGARLRRARRRVDAREPLRAALAAFEQLGAVPWADQAAVELAATGVTVSRRGASPVDALTPQELQVARMLSGGRTTREAAAALFLSPKTVEYHLRHVYLKLGLRTRADLAAALDLAT